MPLGYSYKQRLWPICLGQLVSLCITGTSSVSSALWRQHRVNIPFTQNTCMYFLLTLTFGSWYHFNNVKKNPELEKHIPRAHNQHVRSALLPQQHWHQEPIPTMSSKTRLPYQLLPVLLFSVVDVQANVLAVMAFRNTSVLSALIISSWTLPCIMLLSALLLTARYQPMHYTGVITSLIGLAFLIWGDTMAEANDATDDGSDIFSLNHSWMGDLLCLISATLYAISNVTEEYLIQHFTSRNFLYRIGLTGMIQSGVLAYYFEYDTLMSTQWSRHNIILIMLYVLCLFSMYSLIPTVYRLCGASFVNMSMMTSNFYSLLIGLIFLNAKMPPLYPLAYFLVILGAVLYNLVPPPVYHSQKQEKSQGALPYLDRRHYHSQQRLEQLIP